MITSSSAGATQVFDYESKKRFGLPPTKAHGWDFCWKSPLAPWCSDILFSVVTWVFMHQEWSNDVITGVTLPTENKISSLPFGSYSKALHDADSLILGSQLCLLVFGNVIFLWEIWYLFSDGMQVLINHCLLLKFLKACMSSGSSLNRLCYLDFAGGDAISVTKCQ